MIKLVTLDITNTVIRVLGGVGQQYASIAAIYGIKADPNKLDIAFREKWKEHNTKYPNFGVSNGMKPHVWWGEIVKQCFISSGHPDSKTLSSIATHLYLHFMTEKGWEVLPEANNVLKTMKAKGLKIGVISNFDERLEKVLSNLGIIHNFDFVLGSQLVGNAKPDPIIFQKALDLSGICASEALHVGDHVANDYTGPRSVGMSSLLLCKDMQKIPDHVDKKYVINNLKDVFKFL